MPGDVCAGCESIHSFSGPAQEPFLSGVSAQISGAELQAGWALDAMYICRGADPLLPSLPH